MSEGLLIFNTVLIVYLVWQFTIWFFEWFSDRRARRKMEKAIDKMIDKNDREI